MTIVCSCLVFGAVTRLCSSGLGFPHPPRGDFRGPERGRRARTADVVLHSFGVASIHGERVDHEGTEGNAGQGAYWVVGHPLDGDTPHRAGHAPGPPVHPRPAEHEERAHNERGGHDEIYSVVDLKAGSRRSHLRDSPGASVITEGPHCIEDPHDARHAQRDGREHYPPFTTPIMVFPFSGCGISAPVRHGYADSPSRLGASSPSWG
jgi:hypothetical protein